MSRTTAIVALVLSLALLPAVASASQLTLLQGDLELLVQSSSGVLLMDEGLGVCDQVTLQVALPAAERPTTTFYLNGQPALFSNDQRPTLRLDTTTLAEGAHELKVEAGLDGARLASADLALIVANTAGALQEQIRATTTQSAPVFAKLYRKHIPREVVWFNGREGDLEKHGFRHAGQIYITATDLFRHVGGVIIWGPTHNWIEMHRGDVTLRVVPNSTTVFVNGEGRTLSTPALRRDNRTFVPVMEVCRLLGLHSSWNAEEQRIYVTFQP